MISLNKSIIIILIAFTIIFARDQNSQNINKEKSVLDFLPSSLELEGWHPVGEPEIYKGEDLFLYINGGAEIYHEYGFKEIVFQEYENATNQRINLEIFQMENSEAAFGMYTFKTGVDSQELEIGDGGKIEGYYLNFWKDKYVVTLTGLNPEEEIVDGLLVLAKVIDNKIKDNGEKPSLVNLLPRGELNESSIKYIKGLLGLFNNYIFATENIFSITEGIIANYAEHKLFIFHYKDSEQSGKWFQHAIDHFIESTRFSDISVHEVFVSMQDHKGTPLYLKSHENHIYIILGGDEDLALSIFNTINSK